MGEIAIMLAVVRLRHQHRNIPPDQFIISIAKNLPGRRVCGFDDPSLPNRDYTIHRCIQNRTQAGGQFFLGSWGRAG